MEERLRQREAELAEREIDLLQRELNMMIQQQHHHHQVGVTPTPKKRKGNFTKSRLKLLKKDGSVSSSSIISAPSGEFTYNISRINLRYAYFFYYFGKLFFKFIDFLLLLERVQI